MGGLRILVIVALAALAGAGPAGAAPRWQEARTLDPQWGDHAVVQVDAAGETVLAWQRPVSTGIELMVATRPRGGGFSLPALVAKDVSTGFQSATAGRFTMLMWRGEDDLWAVLREAGGAFSAPQRVATGVSSYYRFALNANGDAAFAYGDRAETVQLVRRSRAGIVGGPLALSAVKSSWPSIALAGDGGALVAWERLVDGRFAIEWREVAADDTFGPVGRLGTDIAQLPWLIGAPDGSALLRWIGGDTTSPALRSGRGAWQPDPVLHPIAGDDVAVAIRDQGRLRLAWREGSAVNVALRDAGGALSDVRQVEALGAAPGTVTLAEGAEGQAIVMATERDPAGGYSAVAAVESGTSWNGVSGIVTPHQQWPSASVGGGVAAVAEWSASGLRVRSFDETDTAPAVAPAAGVAPPAPPAAAPRDVRAPVIGLSRTRRRQRAGSHVVARVACDEICAVAVTGKARAGRSWRLAGRKLALTRPGEAGTLRLKMPARARRALARRGGAARLSIAAFDAAGNRSLARVAIRIARRPR